MGLSEKARKKVLRFQALPRLCLIMMLWALPLGAADNSDADAIDAYGRLLRRYEQVNSELEHVLQGIDCPPDLPEYPQRLLSLRKNAGVTVGGEMRVNYSASRASYSGPFFGPATPGLGLPARTKAGDLRVATANLNLEAWAGDRWRAYFDVNLHGYSGYHRITRLRNPNRPGEPISLDYESDNFVDNIDELYLEFLKAGHSGFGFKAGLMKLPFGLLNRPDLFAQSFLDAPDLTGSYLMQPLNWDRAVRLPHASRFVDPAMALMFNYELRDIIRFEGGVFQEREGNSVYSYRGEGATRYRTDSPLPLSWQVGFNILPLDGWELSATFRNRYSRSRGVHYWADSPYRYDFRANLASGAANPVWDNGQWSDSGTGSGFGARHNSQDFVVGLAVEVPNTNLAVRVEYAHGWNQGFNKYINSDDVNLGLSYRLTPFLTLHGQAEWLFVRDKSWMVADGAGGWARDSRNNQLYRFLLGAEYELLRGLTLEGGWQYEYWRATSARGDGGGHAETVNTAGMLYLGTRFIF